jgi:hypothetical protein
MIKILSTWLLMILMTSVPAFASDDYRNDDQNHGGHHECDRCDNNRSDGHNGDRDRGHPYPGYKDFFRLDCRFHNTENNHGAKFCYASAIYQKHDGKLKNIHMGVGCDNQTIFYDKARLQVETTLDRLSPQRAATPAIEVFPQGQLTTPGTYTSELDISLGRFKGLCYVQEACD